MVLFRRRTAALLLLPALLLVRPAAAPAAGRGEPGPTFPARVALHADEREMRVLAESDILVDAVFDGWARVYLVPEELGKLRRLGLQVSVLPDDAPRQAELARAAAARRFGGPVAAEYHTYDTLTADLLAIADAHPDIVRLSSIGTSVSGRSLWAVKITDAPDVEEDEPGVAYLAAMHGDEVVGKELCFNLIALLTDDYGLDARITALVDSTEISILPSLNPDGTENGRRWNANRVDLNRDFPDQFTDPVDTPAGRQPETQAVMAWAADNTVVLSANFHGGALVVNYPFDSNPASTDTYSPSADDGVLVSLSETYASLNPPLSQSNGHSAFTHGITNGADWYAIDGGMQDWFYRWRGNLDVTVEVSNVKWPDASSLPGFWDDNRESLLAYLERVHEGVRGLVTDAATGLPVVASVRVEGSDFVSLTDPGVGDYHRPLLRGTYDVSFEAAGYTSRTLRDVPVAGVPVTRLDVALAPLAADLQPVSWRVDDGPAGDGWLDPGEAADVAVTLRNEGALATGITARLVSSTGFATVATGPVTHPDLGNGASGESAAPHHRVLVNPAAPVGFPLEFFVEWAADGVSGVSAPFVLRVGAPTCTAVVASDVPAGVFDRSTTGSEVDVPVDVEITSVRVSVDIGHGYINDLRLTLTSPAGTPVILHDRSGGAATTINGTYGVNLPSFDPLPRFRGERSAGTWRLTMADGVPGDTGTLAAWSLEVCGHAPVADVGEVFLRSVRKEAGDVRLGWDPVTGAQSYRVYRASDPWSFGSFADVTGGDADPSDEDFLDPTRPAPIFWLVTAVGARGEGPLGHYGR